MCGNIRFGAEKSIVWERIPQAPHKTDHGMGLLSPLRVHALVCIQLLQLHLHPVNIHFHDTTQTMHVDMLDYLRGEAAVNGDSMLLA